MLRGLGEESRRLTAASERDQEEPQLRAAAAKAAEALAAAETALRQATTELAEARAERGRLNNEKTKIADRTAQFEAQTGEIEQQLATLEAESGGEAKLAELKAEAASSRRWCRNRDRAAQC
ncbi:hypothetical protein AUC69_04165 [Methyloceanibacter superfactus]|uniref:Uncharacterized protein n=1 Tax=Methyloceanibacter superfactus TaxID=1774969 RepID=A0A1E3VJT2_9HYPH|nr:hypothetical protein [Methyloceanibacter superfactus]ODR93762.1 hypothetical protein AUC69_04165 [Methyloceanibacter superfactus]